MPDMYRSTWANLTDALAKNPLRLLRDSIGDYLGFGVAACDFNDGRMDIAASTLYYEDAAARPQSNTQGAVLSFWVTKTAFSRNQTKLWWGAA